jgi:hypothetical protein
MIVAGEYQTAHIMLRLRYHRLWEHVNLRFEDRSYNHNSLRTVVVMTTFPKGAMDKDGNLFQVRTWQETVDKYTNYGNEGPMHSPDPTKRLEAQSIVHAFENMEKQKAKAIEMKGQEAYDRLQDGWYNMCPDALAQWQAAPMLSKLTGSPPEVNTEPRKEQEEPKDEHGYPKEWGFDHFLGMANAAQYGCQ